MASKKNDRGEGIAYDELSWETKGTVPAETETTSPSDGSLADAAFKGLGASGIVVSEKQVANSSDGGQADQAFERLGKD